MNFVDTHCHIDSICKRKKCTSQEVIDELPENCDAIIHSACEPKGLGYPEELLSEINSTDKVWFCAGIHPHNAIDYTDQDHQKLIKLMQHEKCLAWGEIGLDYHYDMSPRNIQKVVFERQLKEAISLNLPIVIHAREADDDMFEILNNNLTQNNKVHIHCYTNTADYALKLQKLPAKIFFGFTGAVTFNNSQEIRDALKVIPINRILLETDAPYMAPIPYRGKCATSGMIPEIVSVMSNTLDIPEVDIYKNCRKNTKMFYGV